MGKPKAQRRLAGGEARAVSRFLRVSPRKLNLVAGQIRGKPVSAALAALMFSRRRIAGEVRKILQSAVANAENVHGLDVDSLHVARASVGRGPKMRRHRAVARGRAHPYRKAVSNLEIVVREEPGENS